MAARLRCGPFDLIDPIGQGSTGVVWRAQHRAQGVDVAVKILTPRRDRVAAAFRNEVRAAARLDHPNVVMLFEQGHLGSGDAEASGGRLETGSPFLAMELCTGGTMADRRSRATWSVLRRYLQEILEALAHAHSRGVIHRDLKPGNALLQGHNTEAQVKLSDFGIAHALVTQSTEIDARHERLSGTLQYMAPEQLAGQWRDEGPWTDLYALGVLTYEAVGGRSPWRATNRQDLVTALLKAAPPVRPRMPVPEALQPWLDRLLAKRPVERFQSAAAALQGLRAMAEPIVWQVGAPAPTPVLPISAAPSTPPLPKSPIVRSISLQGVGLGLYGLRPARLAGRAREKQLAWAELTAAIQEGRPRVILLRGPMGVGTSKLAEWLGENAHATLGATTMLATHGPIPGPGDGLPAMLARYLQGIGLSPERQKLRCARIIEDFPLSDDSPLDASSLARLIAPIDASSHALAISAQQHSVRRTLQRLAQAQPLVISVDNAQWANNALGLCRQLLDDETARLPLVLLVLVDDEALSKRSAEHRRLTSLHSDPRVLTLELGDISPEAHRGLVEDLLGLTPALMDRVCSATNGDALFASALLRHWVRTDALETSASGFALRAQVSQDLPTSLDELWDSQLRTLAHDLEGVDEESLRASLQIAAALGESVHDNEWRAACARAEVFVSDGLVEGLGELNIARQTHLGWRFKHGLIRRHLESQAQRTGQRHSQHRACAEALKTLSRDSDAMQARIGQHQLEANATELAFTPLLRGAIAAREQSDWGESHRLFDLLDHALQAHLPVSEERAIEAQMERVPCYVSQGRIEKARALSEAALVRAQRGAFRQLEALARMGHASIAFAQSDLQEALAQLQQALALLDSTKPLLKLAALTRLGSICMWKRSLEEASSHFAAAQAIIGDDPAYVAERGQTLRGMSHVAHCHNDFVTATQLMLEARACFEQQGNRFAVASCINDLGELQRHQGQFDLAEELYRQALELFESLGAADASTAQCNLGYLLIARTRYAEARELLEELVSSALTRERHIDLMWIFCGLWACAAAQGRWREWDDLQTHVEARRESGLFDDDLARVTRHAGDLARRAGQNRRAQAAYAVAAEQFDGMQDIEKAAEIRRLLADLD